MQRIRDTDRLTESRLTIRNYTKFSVSKQGTFLGRDTPDSVPSVRKMPERGYSVTGLDPDRTVKCSGRELRISPKASVELCRTIKGMRVPEAKKLLERVVAKTQAVAYSSFKKEVPHKKNLNEPWYAGRYPQKAAGKLLHLLEELEANAEYRNLDVEKLKIIHAASQRGPHVPNRRPRAFGRSALLRGTTTHVELVGYELEQ